MKVLYLWCRYFSFSETMEDTTRDFVQRCSHHDALNCVFPNEFRVFCLCVCLELDMIKAIRTCGYTDHMLDEPDHLHAAMNFMRDVVSGELDMHDDDCGFMDVIFGKVFTPFFRSNSYKGCVATHADDDTGSLRLSQLVEKTTYQFLDEIKSSKARQYCHCHTVFR